MDASPPPLLEPSTLARAQGLGWTRRRLQRAVDDGRVRRVLRGVYVDASVPDSIDLRIAAAGLVNCLDPELIVVGGGAGAAGDLVLEPARASLADHVLGPTHRDPVPVVAAGLGPEAGAIGAAFLAAEEGRG